MCCQTLSSTHSTKIHLSQRTFLGFPLTSEWVQDPKGSFSNYIWEFPKFINTGLGPSRVPLRGALSMAYLTMFLSAKADQDTYKHYKFFNY